MQVSDPNMIGAVGRHVPTTAIVECTGITRAQLIEIVTAGGEVRFRAPVTQVEEHGDDYRCSLGGQPVEVEQASACSGLFADRVARTLGIAPDIRISLFAVNISFCLPR